MAMPVLDGNGDLKYLDAGGAGTELSPWQVIHKLAASSEVIGLVAQSGTWTEANSAAMKTALEIIDDIVLTEDAAHSTGAKGVMPLAVRNDSGLALAGSDNDYIPLSTDNLGRLWATINLLTVAGTALAVNAGAASNGVLRIIPANDSPGLYAEDSGHTSTNRGFFPLAVRVDALASQSDASGDYTPFATNAYNQLYVTPSDILSIAQTPTIDTAIYAAGDLIGGKLTFANATRVAAYSGKVTNVMIRDLDAENAPMDLILFNADPSGTTFTNNAALDIADADLSKIFAVIHISDWTTFADNSVAHVGELYKAFKLASGSSIYGALVSRGTPTYASTSDVSVEITVERD